MPTAIEDEHTHSEDSGEDKNLLVFSLYGSDPRYTDGAVANAELWHGIYGPEWGMRVYYDSNIKQSIISRVWTRYSERNPRTIAPMIRCRLRI
jgi:hypothetical protein